MFSAVCIHHGITGFTAHALASLRSLHLSSLHLSMTLQGSVVRLDCTSILPPLPLSPFAFWVLAQPACSYQAQHHGCYPRFLHLRYWDIGPSGIPSNGADKDRPLRYGDASSNLCLNDTKNASPGGYLTLAWCGTSDTESPGTWWGSSGSISQTMTSESTAGPLKSAAEGQNGNNYLCDTLVSNCSTATGKGTNWWIGTWP
jgi:hypothetical protein